MSEDKPEKIISLLEKYPEFKPMYETLYQICQNTEKIMGFFSEELRILDRNTVKYMIEQQQQEIDELTEEVKQKNAQLSEQEEQLCRQDKQLSEQEELLRKQEEELKLLRKQLTKG